MKEIAILTMALAWVGACIVPVDDGPDTQSEQDDIGQSVAEHPINVPPQLADTSRPTPSSACHSICGRGFDLCQAICGCSASLCLTIGDATIGTCGCTLEP